MDLNKCTSSDLSATVPDMTPLLANRIIAFRRRKQRYRSLDEVLEVRGITPEILKTLSRFVTIGKAGRANRDQTVSKPAQPRMVLVVNTNSEKWVDSAKKKGSKKPRTTTKPAPRKSTPRPKPNATRNVKRGTSARKSNRSGRSSQPIKPSTSSPVKRRQPRRESVTTKPNTRRSNIPVPRSGPKSKSSPCSPHKVKSSEVKSAEFVARTKLKQKPPTGKRAVAQSITTRSRLTSKSKSPAIAKRGNRSVKYSAKTRSRQHGQSTVISGSPREIATAHLDNCYVAVHSTPKGNTSPMVTVDINPTSPNFSPPKSGASPGEQRQSFHLSPIRPTANATGKSAVLTKRDVSPISVSESLDELLASSREQSRENESRRSCRGQTSERVSSWLDDNSRYNVSLGDSVRGNQRTPNNTTRACSFRLREFSPSPGRSGASCKRALESDFENDASPVHQRSSSARRRTRDEQLLCSCGHNGICRKCGKVKTPRSRHRAGSSSQDKEIEPNMLSWCNIL